MGATKKPKALKIPKSLAQCADLFWQIRQDRLELDRQSKLLQEQESELREHLINNIPKSQATGISGKLCSVKVETKTVPQVSDWDKFYEFVAKNRTKGSFALLNRAVNASAVSEYWDAGKEVPGVKSFNAVKLSVSKV